jgi:hypothetical protein
MKRTCDPDSHGNTDQQVDGVGNYDVHPEPPFEQVQIQDATEFGACQHKIEWVQN